MEETMLKIKESIRKRLLELVEEERQNAVKALHERINAEADKLALDLLAYYSVERTGANLVITVRKDNIELLKGA